MNIAARTHILTPALWRTLASRKTDQALTTDPLLFLSHSVLYDSELLGTVKLRTIRELATFEALITVYIEGATRTLSSTVSTSDARLYASPQDIVHQNDAFHSIIFKVISSSDEGVVSDIYLWEIPPAAAPDATESDLPLYLPKGSIFYVSPAEQDIVMDRTIRISKDRHASVNIRTVEGRSYSTTVTEAEAVRCATPGDYYVESGSDELSLVYGVTTQSELPFTPIIKSTPLPAMPIST